MASRDQTTATAFYSQKLRETLMSLFQRVGSHPTEASWLVTYGETKVHVSLEPWGPMDGLVNFLALVDKEMVLDLQGAARLLDLNNALALAKFSVDPQGMLLISTQTLASSCSRELVQALVTAVAKGAEHYLSSTTSGARPKSAEVPQEEKPAEAPEEDEPRIRMDDLEIYYCIRGLPISVSEIFHRQEAGESREKILSAYPDLEPADLVAVKAFARQHPEQIEPIKQESAPAPAPESAPPAPKPLRPKRAKARIFQDDLGLYYSIRGLPISAAEVYWKLQKASEEEILKAWPDLEPEDLVAVRSFADKNPGIIEAAKPQPKPVKAPSPARPVPKVGMPERPKIPTRSKPKAKPRIWLDDLGLYYSIRGLPISVSALQKSMNEGKSDQEILAEYPDLEMADLNAARAWEKPDPS